MMRITKNPCSDVGTVESFVPVTAPASPAALYSAMPQYEAPEGLPRKIASLLPVNGEIPDQDGVAELAHRKLIQIVRFAESKPEGIIR